MLSSVRLSRPLLSFRPPPSSLSPPSRPFFSVVCGEDDRDALKACKAMDDMDKLRRLKSGEKRHSYNEKPWMTEKRYQNKKVRNRSFAKVNALSDWIKYDLGRFRPANVRAGGKGGKAS
ncbi:hypothetical protein TeGR_g6502 [Tetraparma gracilis]|uniref:Uncharacterized protein n=1 Tax=Tetraparma gracilis TaxID=2962635 RepID=A0ABQ6MTA2_9STRA|nr:hypothetical protein TeGR_g6502 [Tetraparma gracilis]